MDNTSSTGEAESLRILLLTGVNGEEYRRDLTSEHSITDETVSLSVHIALSPTSGTSPENRDLDRTVT